MCDSGGVINLTWPWSPPLWNGAHYIHDAEISWAPNEGTYVKSLWNSLELLNLYLVFHLPEMTFLVSAASLSANPSFRLRTLLIYYPLHVSSLGAYCIPRFSVLSEYNKKDTGIYTLSSQATPNGSSELSLDFFMVLAFTSLRNNDTSHPPHQLNLQLSDCWIILCLLHPQFPHLRMSYAPNPCTWVYSLYETLISVSPGLNRLSLDLGKRKLLQMGR